MDKDISVVEGFFHRLKPVAAQFASKPSFENVKNYASVIENSVPHIIQNHLEYILFPIYIHLCNTKLSKEIRRTIVELLKTVLTKARITAINYFFKLYSVLLKQVYDSKQKDMLILEEEELKESVVTCLNELLKRCSTDVIQSVYTREHAAKLSQGIYTCISVAKSETLGSARVAAIEALMTLSQVHDEFDTNDIILRTQIGDIIMLFLPGIAHGLSHVAVSSSQQSHKVTMIAIRAYGRIISLVMEDQSEEEEMVSSNNEEPNDPLGIASRRQDNDGMKKHIQTAVRSKKWFEAAAEALKNRTNSLIKLASHSHYRVRKELAIAVNLILSKCSRNLVGNFKDLVEILILLLEDKEDEVKTLARKIIDELTGNISANYNSKSVVETLEENFCQLITELPRSMVIPGMSKDDDSNPVRKLALKRIEFIDSKWYDVTQMSYLSRLSGYIQLLGKERMPHVMSAPMRLQKLVLSLVYVASLDCSHISVLENVQVKDIEESTYNNLHSWKRYKFIRHKSMENKLMNVCKLLATLGNFDVLVETIFCLWKDTPRYRPELTVILNWIAAVELSTGNFSILNFHKQIIDLYIEPTHWYLPMEVQDDVTLVMAQSNIVQCCLMVEGLGIIATNSKEEYQKYLLKTLYIVLELAGSGIAALNNAGQNTLIKIANSQGHGNVETLLRENVDYVSYHVTTKMRRLERNPGVLDVFSVIMKYSTMDLLPCLKEIVEDALQQLSANFNDENSYALLKVLFRFVIYIRKLMECEDSSVAATEEKKYEGQMTGVDREKKIPVAAEIVIQNLLAHYDAKKSAETLPEEIDTIPEESDEVDQRMSGYENETVEEVVEPPINIKMTRDVMKCCLNFLPSRDTKKSLMAMLIMENGLHILSNWNDSLLPIVHKLWHPLVHRFKDDNVLVMNRAWQLLYTLANVSNDFIRSRTLKQIIPCISQFLTKSAKESNLKNEKHAYKFTQMYKLQKLILLQIGNIAKNLRLHERELWQLLDMTEPYLSTNQHPVLQSCCVQLYKEIADCNADIVWIKCHGISNSSNKSHSSEETEVCTKKRRIEHSPKDEPNINTHNRNFLNILSYIEQVEKDKIFKYV